MEVLIKYSCIVLVFWGSVCISFSANEKGFSSIAEAVENPKAVSFVELTADSSSLLMLEGISESLKHLRGLAVKGEVELPEALWNTLSKLDLLEYLFFFDNNLSQLRIGGSSSTLKYLWIKNSPDLDVQSLNSFLNRSNLITSLRLDEVNLFRLPEALSDMPILEGLQISQSNFIFNDLVGLISKNKNLKRLIISDNNFQFLSKGLKKIPSLNYLDISGNNLSEGIPHLKHLKQLDTLVANRNSFENLKPLVKQTQGIGLKLIAFDTKSEKIQDELMYLLPGTTINWNNTVSFSQNLNIPTFKVGAKVVEEIEASQTSKKTGVKSFSSKGDVSLLSEAYLEYDRLVFPEPFKHFDTIRFDGRYFDSSYVFVEKISIQNHTRNEQKYKLKYNRKYGGVKKKNKTVKIDHLKDSHVLFTIYKEKYCEDGIIVNIGFNQMKGNIRSDLKAFQQYTWLLNMSEESFMQDFIIQKAWSDVRIEFDGVDFIIKLKGRYNDDQFSAKLRYRRDPNLLKDIEKNMDKASERYNKSIGREEVRYNKRLEKLKNKQIRPYSKELVVLWATVEAKMVEEEKAMTRPQWIEYYKSVKASEFGLLQNSTLKLAYLARYMSGQGFTEKRRNDFYVGQKWIEVNLRDQNDTMKIKELCIVNLDQKVVTKVDVKGNRVLLEPFHDLIVYGLNDKNQYFSLTKSQVEMLFKQEEVFLDEANFLKTLPSSSIFYKNEIFPQLMY
ncbi:MAG: hypothetical protein ACJA1Z_002379 [Patiriisocius sp.]|jgi:hypothetical protein